METSLAISLVHIYIDVNMYTLYFTLWSVQGKFKVFVEGYDRNILKIIIDEFYLAGNISRKQTFIANKIRIEFSRYLINNREADGAMFSR